MAMLKYDRTRTSTLNMLTRIEAKATRMLVDIEEPGFLASAHDSVKNLIVEVKKCRRLKEGLSLARGATPDLSASNNLVASMVSMADDQSSVEATLNTLQSWAQGYYGDLPA